MRIPPRNLLHAVARMEPSSVRAIVGIAHRSRSGGPLARQSRPDAARALLQPVFERFVEGLDTADLKAAERLLATLG